MDKLKQFNINFSGLADGLHKWTLQLNDSFLAEFENDLVQNAIVKVEVQLEKRSQLLIFDFEMAGTVVTECDICAEIFDLPIESKETLMVKLVNETIESEEPDVMYLKFGSSHVDIAHYLYEMLILAMPMRKVHPNDQHGEPTCNPEILKWLNNNNQPEPQTDENDPPNSVWDALQSLKNKK